MIYDPFPFKCCSKCGCWYPATRQYFYPAHNTKDRLYSSCRLCKNKIKRQYHAEHRLVERALARQYHAEHRDQVNERHWRNRHRNIQKTRERYRNYRSTHLEQEKAKQLRYRQRHPDRVKEADRKRQLKNPEPHRQKEQRRRARKRNLPFTFTLQDWLNAIHYWHGTCAYCGNPPQLWDNPRVLVQEHFIPIDGGGAYAPKNILPACRTCNSSKSNQNPTEWLVRRFGQRRARIILKNIHDYFETLKVSDN